MNFKLPTNKIADHIDLESNALTSDEDISFCGEDYNKYYYLQCVENSLTFGKIINFKEMAEVVCQINLSLDYVRIAKV